MSASDARQLNQTITLDTSNDTDVIDCSIEEIYNKNDFLKTPVSRLKRKCENAKNNEGIPSEGFQFQNENHPVNVLAAQKPRDSLGYKLWSSFKSNDPVISDNNVVAHSTPERVKRSDNKGDAVLHNLISGLKNSPYLPYLCKSKLNRIGNWLNENNVETVTTPPFSNRKRPSLTRKKASSVQPLTPKHSKMAESFDTSFISPEIEKILVAIYGKDWRAKNILKKSTTEPKRNQKQIYNGKTKSNNKAMTDVKSARAVKRNILKGDVRRSLINGQISDDIDSPSSLGVGQLNESGSNDDNFMGRNFSSRRKLRLVSPVIKTPQKRPRVNKKKADDLPKTATPSASTPIARATRSATGDPGASGSRNKTPVKTFLASLSASTPKRKCDPEAQDFKVNFNSKREELTLRLFDLYNSQVFDNRLPKEMTFTWNVKMRRTAGYCHNKKIIKITGEVTRFARIELSAKIVDRADRLRDTLIHELCHAASWIIDGMLDAHGATWTKWAQRAMEKFPELPQIKRCHNYEIFSKYTYKCSGCGHPFHRCSKSINIERKRCGFCFGVLVLYVNRKIKGTGEIPQYKSTPCNTAPNKFALFVKENYHNVKSTRKDAKHGEIMKILSEKYALVKNSAKTPTSGRKQN